MEITNTLDHSCRRVVIAFETLRKGRNDDFSDGMASLSAASQAAIKPA